MRDRLYTVGFDAAAQKDVVWCLDAASGSERWARRFPAELDARGHGGGALTTPAVRDGRVYVTQRRGLVRCFDAARGEVLWTRDVAGDHGLKGTEYGFGASPVLADDLVLYEVGAIVALDAKTGATRWRSADLEAMYSTPTPFEHAGGARLAAFTKRGLYVLDRGSGAELAFHPWRKGRTTVNASSPVVLGDHIFISSGYDHGCAMLALREDGLTPLWESRVMRSKLSGCVARDGFLYGFDESTLKCIDSGGEERWRKRGFGMGALSIAGDRLLILGHRGELVVADASPAGFRERSRQKVFAAGTCWTSPVVCRGRIYCRNSLGGLVCLDHRPR